MTVDKSTETSWGPVEETYEPPALTRFGTIEEWTLGALDGINISIII